MSQTDELVHLLQKHHLTMATAESCTGGGIARKLTNVPGASAVFMGGIVAYDNRIKRKLLSVPETLLKEHGAVSSECAEAMVTGCMKAFETDAAVSVTGIAGPGGGTPEKPVGLVYIGAAFHNKIKVFRFLFHGTREENRTSSEEAALSLITGMILEEFK